MKKNKGFFLAETIIVLALVTTAIAFVLPNVTKVYENYKNVSKYYDQPKDIYSLKAISKLEGVSHEKWKNAFSKTTEVVRKSFYDAVSEKTNSWCNKNIDTLEEIDFVDSQTKRFLKFEHLFIASYLSTPKTQGTALEDDYEFRKYLNRLKKTTYDDTSYRLIGVFPIKDGAGNIVGRRYASIKIPNEKICP